MVVRLLGACGVAFSVFVSSVHALPFEVQGPANCGGKWSPTATKDYFEPAAQPGFLIQSKNKALASQQGLSTSGSRLMVSLQEAIDGMQEYDTLQLNAGTYVLNSGVTIKKPNLRIRGQGIGKTIIQYRGAPKTADQVILIEGASNIQIMGLDIHANEYENGLSAFSTEPSNLASMQFHGAEKGASVIRARNASNLCIHSNAISNFSVDFDSKDLKDVGVKAIFFEKFVSGSKIVNNLIENISLDSDRGQGIVVRNGSSQNLIRGNEVRFTGRGGIFCASPPNLEEQTNNNAFVENRIYGSSSKKEGALGLGLEVFGCPSTLVYHNTVDNWLSIDKASDSAIRRNVVSNKNRTSKFGGIELVESENVVFSDNVVDEGARNGLTTSNGFRKNILWSGNIVRGSTNVGISIFNDSATSSSSPDKKFGTENQYFFRNRVEYSGDFPNLNLVAEQLSQGVRILGNGDANNITFDGLEVGYTREEAFSMSGVAVKNVAIRNSRFYGNVGIRVFEVSPTSAPALFFDQSNVLQNNLSGDQPAIRASAALKAYVRSDAQDEPKNLTPSSPLIAVVGEVLSLKADGEVPVGASILWDLGDGLPVVARTVNKSYDFPGVYKLNMVVWANGRSGIAERTVLVEGTESITPRSPVVNLNVATSSFVPATPTPSAPVLARPIISKQSGGIKILASKVPDAKNYVFTIRTSGSTKKFTATTNAKSIRWASLKSGSTYTILYEVKLKDGTLVGPSASASISR